MSPDEIFAAHMWPWPDPLLKRDGMGRIIFINAAFLQMYGGRVEDWRGNTVGGWPAPQNTGQPFRFETRIAGADGEQVYDWIEYILADGCGLAIARNVTDILSPQDPPPGNIMVTDTGAQTQYNQGAADTAQSEPAPLAAQMSGADTSPQMQSAPSGSLAVDSQPQTQPPQQAPAPQGDWDTDVEYTAPAQEQPPQATPESIAQAWQDQAQTAAPLSPASESFVAAPPASETLTPEMTAQETVAQEAATQEMTAPEFSAPETRAPETPPPAPAILQPPERDHERRALPIENGDAVLGNNWRDAVIAKAVGATMPSGDAAADAQNPSPDMAAQAAAQTATPAHAPQASAQPQTQSAPPAPGGAKSKSDLRILLAEDNAINALLTRTLLEAEGCSVDVVEDGALAVEAVQNATYDMIFMDMRMPNMDGLESTRKIRALTNVPSKMPIVALTANAFDDDRNACFDSGMNDFMTKPVSAEELTQMVETWALRTDEQRLAS